MTRAYLLALVLLCAPSFAAERYLIPVLVSVPGAHDSLFVADLVLFNAGTTSTTVSGLAFSCVFTCPPPVYEFEAEPGTSYESFQRPGNPGLIVTADGEPDLRMNLRVRDTSRGQLSAGTEIPVVSEAEMRRSPVILLHIPPEGADFRNRLRVYSFSPGTVEVRFVRESDSAILLQETLSLSTPPESGPSYPAFAQTASFPETGSFLRIEIRALSGTDGLWGFVTTTNNQTQEITVVSPHP